MAKADPKNHICKHGNDDELCQEICAEKDCGDKCCYHGIGSCGLCDCQKFIDKKKKSKKGKKK